MNEKPMPPGPSECCEGGCEPCVWDIYREELRKWQEAQKTRDKTEGPDKKTG